MDSNMRLGDFIQANVERILQEWEEFARRIWPDVAGDDAVEPAVLRDHAEQLLQATVIDMQSAQTAYQQSAKSKGDGEQGESSVRVDRASDLHGADRENSGFTLWALVAEYRALRASVLRLWRESDPQPDLNDIDDVTRFNECIDQSLAEAVRSYTEQVQRDREALLENEQRARNDAENANRAKDMFLATLSHELRTPLNAIVGWVDILRTEGLNETVFTEGLDVIERNTKAQVQLIDDVLDVSRIVSGKLRLEIKDSDLIEAVKAGIDVVRPTAEARDISLDVQLDSEARRASVDVARIQQIVWNLLTNAIKFTQRGGAIHVGLGREASVLRLSVSDNGQGVSPEVLPHIFERFRQADSSSRRAYGGLGLGLSIVKHLTEMHGGTVEAQSQGEGQGTTFIVRLPIKAVQMDDSNDALAHEKERKSETTSHASRPVRLDGLHVLVVDDEADARRVLAKVLEKVGAQVTTAGTAADALAILEGGAEDGRKLDLLLSDVGMPGQNGYDLIREVRRRGIHAGQLPGIALTAYAHSDDAREAALAGFQVHVAKPVVVPDLISVIARLTGRSQIEE